MNPMRRRIMNTQDKINIMMEKFVHPSSLYAEQVYKEDKGMMYFVVREDKDGERVEKVFTEYQMKQHLMGERTFAPYQISADSKVKWLCLDIDRAPRTQTEFQYMEQQLMNLARTTRKYIGPRFLVEDSGSKGFHIWIFFTKEISATKAYALGHFLAAQTEAVDGVHIEVYPKQLTVGSFGNTVKLPLGVHQKTKNRCFFIDASFKPKENQWEALQNVQTLDEEWIDQNLSKQIEEIENRPEPESSSRAPKCFEHILKHGVNKGARDEPTFQLACYLKESGIPQEYAESMLDTWDAEKNVPPMGNVIDTKIASAYSRDYKPSPCGSALFDEYCHSSCTSFSYKKRIRWARFGKKGDPIGVLSVD
jgi:hypothetical protein